MKRFILALVILYGLASCSSDDNTSKERSELLGKWIPQTAYVNVLGADMEESYPHRINCEKDFLDIEDTKTTFAFHSDNCQENKFTDSYKHSKNKISLNLLGTKVELEVLSNTDNSLRLKGTGEDFKSLIPVLFPDYAQMLPIGILPMVNVELVLTK